VALPPATLPPLALPPLALPPVAPPELEYVEETAVRLPPAEASPPCTCGDDVPPAFPELLVQPRSKFKPKTASRAPTGLRGLCIGLFILGTG
jgi:hypothetical protein